LADALATLFSENQRTRCLIITFGARQSVRL